MDADDIIRDDIIHGNGDIVERSDLLDQHIIAIPKDKVFTKQIVVAGFVFIVALMTAYFTIQFLILRDITASTNRVVKQQTNVLQDRIEEQAQTIVDLEEIQVQAIDGILLQNKMLREAGVEPPEIILRPTRGQEQPDND